jgi:hypothetical protein
MPTGNAELYFRMKFGHHAAVVTALVTNIHAELTALNIAVP